MMKSSYKTDHTKFGGLIYLCDFNTNFSKQYAAKESSVANRIANDMRFDEQCRKIRQELEVEKI